MNQFMDKDFLLTTKTAQILYHEYAVKQPVFDYHNHISPKDIAQHRRFSDLTQLWLESDHYRWRTMRACGVEERFITGDASSYEKFEAWAQVLPRLAGCPVYHWTHLELQRYFGITQPLTAESAKRIWEQTSEMLRTDGFDAVSFLGKMNVRVLCTTDDPADTLEWHRKIAQDDSIPFRVCPSFRPDRYLADPDGGASQALCGKYGTSDPETALEKALDWFCENGCLVSDHGINDLPYLTDPVFAGRLRFLAAAYEKRGIVMQLHFGPIRNLSPRLSALIGPDAGGDSVGHTTDPADIGAFLGDLERAGNLPKTILYNLNPADSMVLSTMAVNFAPRVQYGAAWWFNDHIRGIKRQIHELMETGALSASVGMLTDSRSVTSFVRHEYFRRILCDVLGRLVEDGEYPDDTQTLGKIVEDVCYGNAVSFFS